MEKLVEREIEDNQLINCNYCPFLSAKLRQVFGVFSGILYRNMYVCDNNRSVEKVSGWPVLEDVKISASTHRLT